MIVARVRLDGLYIREGLARMDRPGENLRVVELDFQAFFKFTVPGFKVNISYKNMNKSHEHAES